jgi:iron complex transport system ATP-binding protein
MTVALEAQTLSCTLGGRAVVAQVSLAARPGEVLALIGPNGAGKTTLLRALARLLRPQGGAALLGGQAIWQLRPRTVARQLAMAQQGGADGTPLTVAQLVALGRAPHRGWLLPLTSEDRAAVELALERTGVSHLRERPLSELSGGEQRRAILARALAQEPRALLLDEPTSALDLKYQVSILDLAMRLAHHDGLTVVVTLHDLNQAALVADRMALLAEGRLLAIGTPREVLNAELLARAYGVPVAVGAHPVYGTPLVTALIPSRREEYNHD